jgi:hypothetical protein
LHSAVWSKYCSPARYQWRATTMKAPASFHFSLSTVAVRSWRATLKAILPSHICCFDT